GEAVVALPGDQDPVDVDDPERNARAVDRYVDSLAREQPSREPGLGRGPRGRERRRRPEGRERGREDEHAPTPLRARGAHAGARAAGQRCPPNRYCGRIVIARLVRSLHDWIIFTCPVELPPAKLTSASSSSFSLCVTW